MRTATALALVALLAGCSSQAIHVAPDASGDTSVSDGGAAFDAASDEDCGTLPWASGDCAACTNAHCCSIQALCAALAECTPLTTCWQGCGADAGCPSACASKYIGAISNFNAVLNCQAQSCASQCP